MRNGIPTDLMSKVVERPSDISIRSGIRSIKYDELAAALKNISATKALAYSEPEISNLYGKHWRTALTSQMKKRGIKLARAIKDDTIYLWKRGA